MKKITLPLLLVALFTAVTCLAQMPPSPPRPMSPPPGAQAEPAREPVNYVLRVEWSEPKGESKYLELTTTEGQFDLNTIQKNSVKINNSEVPVTLKVSGDIRELNPDKGRLQLFLGRTVPYVTGSSGLGGGVSYSQMSVGLNSTFFVDFGKPLVIQSDENGDITVLVKRKGK